MPDKPHCIKCHRDSQVRKRTARTWFCDACKIEFDPLDDGEKGGNPARRAEDKEEFELRQKARRQRFLAGRRFR